MSTMPVLGVATAYGDVDQIVVLIVAFLGILTIGLVLAAYLEPGSEAKLPRLPKRLARVRAPRSENRD